MKCGATISQQAEHHLTRTSTRAHIETHLGPYSPTSFQYPSLNWIKAVLSAGFHVHSVSAELNGATALGCNKRRLVISGSPPLSIVLNFLSLFLVLSSLSLSSSPQLHRLHPADPSVKVLM